MGKQDNVFGIYAASGKLSVAAYKGKTLMTDWVDVPTNIVQNGEILSKNLLISFLKDTLKKYHLKTKKAVFIISGDRVLTKTVTMPMMSNEQIRYNIPFEFRDLIKGELKDYIYDYAYRPPLEKSEGDDAEEKKIDLLAVAIPAAFYENLEECVARAGLKLVVSTPDLCMMEQILGLYETEEERLKERCLLDIGIDRCKMQIYKNGRYKLSHVIDIGENYIVRTIADEMNVDMELARTYIRTNYEDCLNMPAAVNAYKDISLEVLKGFNYYEMSDMSSRLNDVVLYGGGAMIGPLVDILKERIDKNVLTMSETFPQYNTNEDLDITIVAIGALLG